MKYLRVKMITRLVGVRNELIREEFGINTTVHIEKTTELVETFKQNEHYQTEEQKKKGRSRETSDSLIGKVLKKNKTWKEAEDLKQNRNKWSAFMDG